jgi:hypothetical protein
VIPVSLRRAHATSSCPGDVFSFADCRFCSRTSGRNVPFIKRASLPEYGATRRQRSQVASARPISGGFAIPLGRSCVQGLLFARVASRRAIRAILSPPLDQGRYGFTEKKWSATGSLRELNSIAEAVPCASSMQRRQVQRRPLFLWSAKVMVNAYMRNPAKLDSAGIVAANCGQGRAAKTTLFGTQKRCSGKRGGPLRGKCFDFVSS